jgi:hypothetical protein
MTKAIGKRLCKLETRFGLGRESDQLLVVLTLAGCGLALDADACVQILRESGFLPTYPLGLVNLGNIPGGLTAKETERFLRDHGAEICESRGFPFTTNERRSAPY